MTNYTSPIQIDPRWVDVDFPTVAGVSLGAMPREEPFGQAGFPVFEETVPIIPRKEWPDRVEAIDKAGGMCDQLVTRIYNQRQEPSCTSNATGQSNEVVQASQYGKDKVVHLSAISLYMRVGSRSSGSSVSSNLKEMRDVGILPLDNEANRKAYPHVMANTGYGTSYPDGWKDTAKLFRAQEWFDVEGVEGFITALILGFPVVYGRDGHAICGVRPVFINGLIHDKYANSWGDWGDNGYGYDSESKIRAGATRYGCFALRAVVVNQPQAA
jgi:hypothetical protein